MSAGTGLNGVAWLCIVLGVCVELPYTYAQTAQTAQTALRAPSQELQTPYSSESEGFEARANLKRLLTAQLGRAAADGRTGPTSSSHLRHPALYAPSSAQSVPPQPQPQPQLPPTTVRVSRPRYVDAPFDADDGSSSVEDDDTNEKQATDGDADYNYRDNDDNYDDDDDDDDLTAPQPKSVPSTPSDIGHAEEDDDDVDDDDDDDNDDDDDLTAPQPKSVTSSRSDIGQAKDDNDAEEEAQSEAEQEVYNPHRDNFYDLNADGSYVFGYSLPNGVRRYERSYYAKPNHNRLVEGFYAQPRQMPQGLVYELRCYRSDINGYQPLSVEYLRRPPRVQHYETPDVDCLKRT